MDYAPFIRVSKNEKDTIEKLSSMGFVKLKDSSESEVVFLNDKTKSLTFENEPLKVTYSNVMFI